MCVKQDTIWVFVDNEGPCTLNDNAFETTVALAEKCGLGAEVGQKFYRYMSVIDDIWGDFQRVAYIDPTYSSGHTLKIMLPFYKAMGADSRWLYEFARGSIRTVPRIDDVLTVLDHRYNIRMISTSYDFFIQAFCDLVGLEMTKVSCTRVGDFDGIPISARQTAALREFMKGVAQLPIIEYDQQTGEIAEEYRFDYDVITLFIWHYVRDIAVGEFFRNVYPVGQRQKAERMVLTCQLNDVTMDKVMYVGDSQTDVQCVEHLVGKGLSLVFNGKGRVCDLADLMYVGESALAIQEVASYFSARGRAGTINRYSPPRYPAYGGVLGAVTRETLPTLKLMSEAKRKEFRGQHIGALS